MNMKIDWLLWAVVVALIVTIGLSMYHYVGLQESIEVQNGIVEAVEKNQRIISRMENQLRVGPRNTACDAKKMLEEMRRLGIPMSPTEVEKRCSDHD